MAMKFLIFIFIGTVAFTTALAQDGYGSTSIYDRTVQLPKNKHFFILPPNGNWEKQKWADSVHQFPVFASGKLEMTNGLTLNHTPLLNYNILSEAMEIKPSTGRIIVMRPSYLIRKVFVGEHEFLWDPGFGYLEILMKGTVSVARKVYMEGIYETGTGQRYPIDVNDIRTSPSKHRIYFWIEEQYFMLKPDMKPFRAGSHVLPAVFPHHKKLIKAFAKSNKISYKKKDDVLKLVAYANQLD